MSEDVDPEKFAAALKSLSDHGVLPRATELHVGGIKVAMHPAAPESKLPDKPQGGMDPDTLFASS